MFFPLMNDEFFGRHDIHHAIKQFLRNPGFIGCAILRPPPVVLRPQPMDNEGEPAARRALLVIVLASLPSAITRRPGERQDIVVELARLLNFSPGNLGEAEIQDNQKYGYFAGSSDCASNLGKCLERDSGHVGAIIFQEGLLRFISQRASLP